MTDRELMQQALEVLDSKHDFNSAEWRVMHYRLFEALRARLADEVDVQYEVWQDDEWQAGSNSLNEAMHYAAVYAQDGPVVVHEVTRREICKIEN